MRNIYLFMMRFSMKSIRDSDKAVVSARAPIDILGYIPYLATKLSLKVKPSHMKPRILAPFRRV